MRETLHTAAFKCENDMRAICGMGAKTFGDPLLQDLSPAEVEQMTALVAMSGRDGFTQVMKNTMEFLIKRYMANGHPDPRTPVTTPGENGMTAAGSFELISIADLKYIYSKIKNLITKSTIR